MLHHTYWFRPIRRSNTFLLEICINKIQFVKFNFITDKISAHSKRYGIFEKVHFECHCSSMCMMQCNQWFVSLIKYRKHCWSKSYCSKKETLCRILYKWQSQNVNYFPTSRARFNPFWFTFSNLKSVNTVSSSETTLYIHSTPRFKYGIPTISTNTSWTT